MFIHTTVVVSLSHMQIASISIIVRVFPTEFLTARCCANGILWRGLTVVVVGVLSFSFFFLPSLLSFVSGKTTWPRESLTISLLLRFALYYFLLCAQGKDISHNPTCACSLVNVCVCVRMFMYA